ISDRESRYKLIGLINRGIMNNGFLLLRQIIDVLDDVEFFGCAQYHIHAGNFGDFLGFQLRIAAYNRDIGIWRVLRSEEHTSELQSREKLVCRLLPEKNKSEIQTRESVVFR